MNRVNRTAKVWPVRASQRRRDKVLTRSRRAGRPRSMGVESGIGPRIQLQARGRNGEADTFRIIASSRPQPQTPALRIPAFVVWRDAAPGQETPHVPDHRHVSSIRFRCAGRIATGNRARSADQDLQRCTRGRSTDAHRRSGLGVRASGRERRRQDYDHRHDHGVDPADVGPGRGARNRHGQGSPSRARSHELREPLRRHAATG